MLSTTLTVCCVFRRATLLSRLLTSLVFQASITVMSQISDAAPLTAAVDSEEKLKNAGYKYYDIL